MNEKQLLRMKNDPGFIAALDQSGGSTPKALAAYGVTADEYSNEAEMFDMVHAMRTRIITNPAFEPSKILGAILFEQTMDREIEGLPTATYLWQKKGIVPFLKVDKGLAAEENGVQLLKPMPELDDLLKKASQYPVFGTKMRSLINSCNPEGIKAVVDQQFAFAKQILSHGFVPIVEPEVNIHSADKVESEKVLKAEILRNLDALGEGEVVILKLSIPTIADFYKELIEHAKVVRVVALSGGYEREEANELLAKNHGLIASFSRALAEGLNAKQTDAAFEATLRATIDATYKASIT